MLSVVLLNVEMLSVIMLSAIMLNVDVLSVVAPRKAHLIGKGVQCIVQSQDENGQNHTFKINPRKVNLKTRGVIFGIAGVLGTHLLQTS